MTEATQTLTLTDFLLARIAEDRAAAPFRHATGCRLCARGGACDCGFPSQVAAECKAKRRIVDHFSGRPEFWGEIAAVPLRALAAVYADHPDYRDEWRS